MILCQFWPIRHSPFWNVKMAALFKISRRTSKYCVVAAKGRDMSDGQYVE